jgi:Thrombospondin type 1 domain
MKPADVRVCNSPCPQNCEVSSWSAWSHCSEDCALGNSKRTITRIKTNTIFNIGEKSKSKAAPTQIRHRVVLKQPRSGGSQCPVLEELRPCPVDTEICKTHSWWMGEWSQCRLPSNVECGQGYRTRGAEKNFSKRNGVLHFYVFSSCSNCVRTEWKEKSRPE